MWTTKSIWDGAYLMCCGMKFDSFSKGDSIEKVIFSFRTEGQDPRALMQSYSRGLASVNPREHRQNYLFLRQIILQQRPNSTEEAVRQ